MQVSTSLALRISHAVCGASWKRSNRSNRSIGEQKLRTLSAPPGRPSTKAQAMAVWLANLWTFRYSRCHECSMSTPRAEQRPSKKIVSHTDDRAHILTTLGLQMSSSLPRLTSCARGGPASRRASIACCASWRLSQHTQAQPEGGTRWLNTGQGFRRRRAADDGCVNGEPALKYGRKTNRGMRARVPKSLRNAESCVTPSCTDTRKSRSCQFCCT